MIDQETLGASIAYTKAHGGGGGGGDVTGVKGDAESTYRKGNVNITLANIGLGNVDNTSDLNKPISTATQSALDAKVDKVTGKGLSSNDYTNADKAIVDGVTSALADKVDKVTGKGLSTNDYDDTAKGIVDGVTTALAGKVSTTSVGSANGVAELDANGRVPSSQLPSYVDDTIEGYLNSVDGKFYADSSYTTEITGETGKIYVTLDTNKTYRWSGSGFVEISESLALGETPSTAYAGNKGKANADAITAIKDGTNLDSFADVEDAFNYLTFEGTQANWNLLSTAEKKKYKQVIFTDDYDDNPVGNLNALTTTDKSSVVGAINEVKTALITPSTNYLLLGFAAIDGSNSVTVSLGDNKINDYDFLWIGNAYYNTGVATYGCVLVPAILMDYLYGGDAGVAIMSRDNTNTGVTPINARYSGTNNTIVFNPEGTPAGQYYYVYGVKIRTAS